MDNTDLAIESELRIADGLDQGPKLKWLALYLSLRSLWYLRLAIYAHDKGECNIQATEHRQVPVQMGSDDVVHKRRARSIVSGCPNLQYSGAK